MKGNFFKKITLKPLHKPVQTTSFKSPHPQKKLEHNSKKKNFSVCLVKNIFVNLLYYSVYFCYYSWVPLHFLVLFMGIFIFYQFSNSATHQIKFDINNDGLNNKIDKLIGSQIHNGVNIDGLTH